MQRTATPIRYFHKIGAMAYGVWVRKVINTELANTVGLIPHKLHPGPM